MTSLGWSWSVTAVITDDSVLILHRAVVDKEGIGKFFLAAVIPIGDTAATRRVFVRGQFSQ